MSKEELFRLIELALSSSHNVVATDLPHSKEAMTLLKQDKAWTIDHSKELEALRELKDMVCFC